QLAVGRLPFEGATPHSLLKRIAGGEYLPPERANPHVHAQLARIITRALARDPARRYQSAGALLEDIDAMLLRLGIDGEAGLKTLLADPQAHARDLQAQLGGRYLALGRAAMARGATGHAVEDFNRILAIDPNHAEVRSILKRLSARQWTWRVARAVGLGALGAALITLVAPSIAQWWQASARVLAARPGATLAAVTLTRDVPFELRGRGDLYINGQLVGSAVTGVISHALAAGPHSARLVGDKKSDEASFTVPSAGPVSAVRLDVVVVETPVVRTREIAFKPGTGWVTVYVDGAREPAIREAMGDFKLRLPYGTRRLRFENDRAQPLERELVVSDGEPIGVVVIHLKPLPAKLYIDGAPDGAIVEVAGKATLINERTRGEPIFVPLEFAPGEKSRAYDVSVKKDGQTFRQRMVFHAGEEQRLQVPGEPL
ncbi:MAG: hypothetical protein HYZ27_08760, partial [Deltaproteobacteria bacterium]|nr:hypothetical protein [Deltaproteobacteria bacterium]